jgi:hypothetical protein
MKPEDHPDHIANPTLGVTSDFDWYELSTMRSALDAVLSRVDRLINTVKLREKGLHDYIFYLQNQNSIQQSELDALREEYR